MHDRGDRERGRSYHSGGGGGGERDDEKRSPEEEATQRVYLVRLEVDSVAIRAGKLSAILHRDAWRKERAELEATHTGLETSLQARESDAKASEQAYEEYTAATATLHGIGKVLEDAKEPHRPVPPVSGEEAIEPSIVNGSAIPDDVIAWVAGMSASESRAIVERVKHVQQSVDRKDAFAVRLANYLGNKRILAPFFEVAKDPRRFNRPAYEKARARATANGAAERGGVTGGAKPAMPAAATSATSAASGAGQADDRAQVDTNASLVNAHGPGGRLPPVAAVPAAHVHRAPKLLIPDADAPPRGTTIQVPDADHPSRRGMDGEQVIQTGKTTVPGRAPPLRGTSWQSLAEVTESVDVQVDSGDTLHIDITYRLESRPAEVGEVPDLWIHTERKALLTIGSGEHAGATIVGQARIRLAPGEAHDPKAAIAKASIGAAHWAQIYLAEAKQYVNLHSAGGRASLLADAADNDVLAYDDPLRMLVGLKNLLKQQHVAGHGGDVARMHARAQRLLADAKRGRVVLEREIASVASYHDPHPGRIAPVRFLVGDIAEWLAVNQRAGRDDTEDAHQLRKARAGLEHLIADTEKVHPPRRHQLDDALDASVRFVERTAEGVAEVGAMAVDAVVLGIDAIGEATGIGTFDYHPISKYGKSVDATGANATTALVTMVNGFADEWSDAIERAQHGDYRSLTDVSIDTLMMIDGARTGGAIALEKAEALAAKLGNVAKSAHAVASRLPAEARDIAAAMADGADAFVARLRAGGMQMATAGGGGGPGPNLGGLSAEALAEAAQAAKEAFKDKRLTQEAANHAAAHTDTAKSSPADPAPPADSAPRPDPEQAVAEKTAADKAEKEAQQAAKSAAGNAETNATQKYTFEASEKAAVEQKTRDAAVKAAEKAYKDAIVAGEAPAKANTAATKAAKAAAETVAKKEAERTASEAAKRAIDRAQTIDMGAVDSKTQSQLAAFDAGTTGAEANGCRSAHVTRP